MDYLTQNSSDSSGRHHSLKRRLIIIMGELSIVAFKNTNHWIPLCVCVVKPYCVGLQCKGNRGNGQFIAVGYTYNIQYPHSWLMMYCMCQ